MSKPNSFRQQPWTQLSREQYSILTDDYSYQKLLTVKVTQKANKGTVHLKNCVVKKDDTLKSSGQIKLWFPVWSRGGTLYFKSINNEVKLHYDDGVQLLKERLFNFYGSVQCHKNFKNFVVKAGVHLLSDETSNFDLDSRVRFGFNKNDTDVSVGHKLNYTKDNFKLSILDVYQLKSFAFLKRAVRFGYTQSSNLFFFRAEGDTRQQMKGFKFEDLYEKYAFNWVRNIDDNNKIAMEAEFTRKQIENVSGVYQRKVADKDVTWKIRAASNKSLALAYQSAIKDYGKWIFGLEVSNIGEKNLVKYGFQVDLNL